MGEAGMVIVGAGEAGAAAALALRGKGWTGPITLIGEEPRAPYERPPLSKAVMTSANEPSAPTILTDATMREKEIEHAAAIRAIAIDPAARCVVLADGRRIAYRKLLLATGVAARRLSVAGSGGLIYLRTFDDALAIRSRLQPGAHIGLIGGGFIGLELAASAVQRGCKVTVLEMAPRILMRGVTEGLAERIAGLHRRAGVDLRTAVGILAIEHSGNHQTIVLNDGARITCDAVIAGVGAQPSMDLAVTGGLEFENGIRVDAYLRTSTPDIYAAGDCCSFPHPLYDGRRIRLEAWRNAREQGAVAAANMLGETAIYDAVPSFWSDQYDVTLRIAGLADGAARTLVRDLGEGIQLNFHLAEDGRLLAASSLGPDRIIAKELRLAEMLIAKRARPDVGALANPEVRLKSLLAA
jgi:3-phenylpropionate/trans-cinnamate dioxygenase ferredoxin reductase subunit